MNNYQINEGVEHVLHEPAVENGADHGDDVNGDVNDAVNDDNNLNNIQADNVNADIRNQAIHEIAQQNVQWMENLPLDVEDQYDNVNEIEEGPGVEIGAEQQALNIEPQPNVSYFSYFFKSESNNEQLF